MSAQAFFVAKNSVSAGAICSTCARTAATISAGALAGLPNGVAGCESHSAMSCRPPATSGPTICEIRLRPKSIPATRHGATQTASAHAHALDGHEVGEAPDGRYDLACSFVCVNHISVTRPKSTSAPARTEAGWNLASGADKWIRRARPSDPEQGVQA